MVISIEHSFGVVNRFLEFYRMFVLDFVWVIWNLQYALNVLYYDFYLVN